MEKGIRLVAQ